MKIKKFMMMLVFSLPFLAVGVAHAAYSHQIAVTITQDIWGAPAGYKVVIVGRKDGISVTAPLAQTSNPNGSGYQLATLRADGITVQSIQPSPLVNANNPAGPTPYNYTWTYSLNTTYTPRVFHGNTEDWVNADLNWTYQQFETLAYLQLYNGTTLVKDKIPCQLRSGSFTVGKGLHIGYAISTFANIYSCYIDPV